MCNNEMLWGQVFRLRVGAKKSLMGYDTLFFEFCQQEVSRFLMMSSSTTIKCCNQKAKMPKCNTLLLLHLFCNGQYIAQTAMFYISHKYVRQYIVRSNVIVNGYCRKTAVICCDVLVCGCFVFCVSFFLLTREQ